MRPAELAHILGAALLYHGFFGGCAVYGLKVAIHGIRTSNTVMASWGAVLRPT
jgi:hypothetical protein